MEKDEKIDEMAFLMCQREDGRICDRFPCESCPLYMLAEILYEAGYRKVKEDRYNDQR